MVVGQSFADRKESQGLVHLDLPELLDPLVALAVHLGCIGLVVGLRIGQLEHLECFLVVVVRIDLVVLVHLNLRTVVDLVVLLVPLVLQVLPGRRTDLVVHLEVLLELRNHIGLVVVVQIAQVVEVRHTGLVVLPVLQVLRVLLARRMVVVRGLLVGLRTDQVEVERRIDRVAVDLHTDLVVAKHRNRLGLELDHLDSLVVLDHRILLSVVGADRHIAAVGRRKVMGRHRVVVVVAVVVDRIELEEGCSVQIHVESWRVVRSRNLVAVVEAAKA